VACDAVQWCAGLTAHKTTTWTFLVVETPNLRLHNEELRNVYSSTNIIRVMKSRRMRWVGLVVRMREMRNAYKILVGKPKGKRPLGRSWNRWKGNNSMNLREIGWDDADWMDRTRGRGQWRARQITFGFHRRQGIYWLAERLLASQGRLYSMDLAS
jgi:hypothetical protein